MFEKNDKKQETPQRNLRRFLYWGEPKKEHFVLRDITLRFIFSERFVLRIIDIKAKKHLDRMQRANYRWMLIQPMMTIDNYSLTCLTNNQEEQILRIADNLPKYICYLDGDTEEAKKNSQHLIDMLSNYFLKAYLRSLV